MLSLICFALIISLLVIHIIPSQEQSVSSEIISEMKGITWSSMNKSNAPEISETNLTSIDNARESTTKLSSQPSILFSFDPNTTSPEEWQALGLTPKQAATIINYVSKGGKFRVKEDLKKMFVITPSFYARVEPYINIPPPAVQKMSDTTSHPLIPEASVSKVRMQVEINTASALELEALPGIGPAIAKGIVAYRNKLRGFSNLEQLREVYFFNDSIFILNKDRLTCNPDYIRPININTNDIEQLKHPYIEKYLARVIVAYRKEHGDFKDKKQLLLLDVLPKEEYNKIAPYIDVK